MIDNSEDKIIIIYICPICKSHYFTIKEAVACYNKGFDEPIVKAGDIVELKAGFGWYDGDIKWVQNPMPYTELHQNKEHNNDVRRCFKKCCTMSFYYVVTAIDNVGHRTRYHVCTKAMTFESGYRSGFTFKEHHYTPKKINNPPVYVVSGGTELLGQKFMRLI